MFFDELAVLRAQQPNLAKPRNLFPLAAIKVQNEMLACGYILRSIAYINATHHKISGLISLSLA